MAVDFGYYKDVISDTVRQRKVWVIAGAIVVMLLIVILIVVITSSSSAAPNTDHTKPMKFSDINEFYASEFNATWISDTEMTFFLANSDFVIHDVNTQKNVILVPGSISKTYESHLMSPDRKFVLMPYNAQKVFRRSSTSQYKIYDVTNKKLVDLMHENKAERFHLVTWTPSGNSILYIFNNNLYYLADPSKNGQAVPITKDGVPGVIYNGLSDWVYEEEVLASNKAVWSSPKSDRLAFIHFNDTVVLPMLLPLYGDTQYPTLFQIKYPKVGSPNPIVTLYVRNDLTNDKATLVELKPPTALNEKEPIIASVSWPTNDDVLVLWTNRNQDHAFVVSYNVKNEAAITSFVVNEMKEDNGWINIEEFVPIYNDDGSQFLIVAPHDQGDAVHGNYRHVTLFERKENAAGKALSKGVFSVTSILSWKRNKIYFLGTVENAPTKRHLYKLDMSKPDPASECITCNLKRSDDATSDYFDVELSTNGTFAALTFLGPAVPEVSIFNLETSATIAMLEKNEKVKAAEKLYALPEIEVFTVKTPANFDATVRLLLPRNMDRSGNTKYPMLVHCYAGPGTSLVTDEFGVDWDHYFSSSHNVIIAHIDAAGRNLNGDKMMFAQYKSFGQVEVDDQTFITRYLQDNKPYIDKERTAVWGWSYGGYVSGMVLARDTKKTFKCAVSVAPVTDWKYYDSIYTERYMRQRTKEDNMVGYETASLVKQADNFRNKSYFLIHGSFDDNVHFQQTAVLARVFETHDIAFRELVYTDEQHSISHALLHLYHAIENFFEECFRKDGN